MRRVLSVLAAGMAILTVALGAVYSAPKETPRGFDLRRLDALHGPGTADELTDSYLTFLREETTNPSTPRRGLGGTITHGYILAQIVYPARVMNDARLLAAAGAAQPGEFRDGIMLTLALRGHKGATPFLITYLADAGKHWRLRAHAGRALQEHPDPRAVPVLAEMLNDATWHVKRGVARTVEEGDVYLKCYDLRNGARSALWAYQRAGIELPPAVQQRLANVVVTERYDPVRDGPKPKD